MKNRRVTLFIIAVLGIAIIALLVLPRKQQDSEKDASRRGNQKQYSSETGGALQVLSSVPEQNGRHSPFLPVEITFNQPIDVRSASVSLSPPAEVKTEVTGSVLRVIPKETFLGETTYALDVATVPPFQLRFMTEQIASNPPGWNELFSQSYEEYRKQYGAQNDALAEIRKNAPINGPGFTVLYSYRTNTYTVELLTKPYSRTKQGALNWFGSQGITDLSQLRLVWIER